MTSTRVSCTVNKRCMLCSPAEGTSPPAIANKCVQPTGGTESSDPVGATPKLSREQYAQKNVLHSSFPRETYPVVILCTYPSEGPHYRKELVPISAVARLAGEGYAPMICAAEPCSRVGGKTVQAKGQLNCDEKPRGYLGESLDCVPLYTLLIGCSDRLSYCVAQAPLVFLGNHTLHRLF